MAIPLIVALVMQFGNTTAEEHSGIFERIVPVCYPPGREPPAYDFRLVNQYGRWVQLSDLWNETVLMTFTYTYCPDVCPMMHYVLNKSLPQIKPHIKWILDISLDPERDTVERIFHYSRGNGYNWTFLTGSASELEAVWQSYRVTRYVTTLNGKFYIAHDMVWIVVRDGVILGVVRGLPAPETLAHYITKIVERRC